MGDRRPEDTVGRQPGDAPSESGSEESAPPRREDSRPALLRDLLDALGLSGASPERASKKKIPDKPYEREASVAWANDVVTDEKFHVWVNDEAVALQGCCPRCKHQIDDFVPLDLGFAERFARGKAEVVDPVSKLNDPTEIRIVQGQC